MAHLAWFSPMPPTRSGVALASVDILRLLRDEHDIDVFVDEITLPDARRLAQGDRLSIHGAHDFVWRHQLHRYAVAVYQLGNSSAHDFLCPYLFRFPGVAVLHDTHLHHARAAALLRQRRPADYRDEFRAAHPDATADAAELAIAGFDNYLYYSWPMNALVIRRSRVAAVHSAIAQRELETLHPGSAVEHIRLAHGEIVTLERRAQARRRVCAKHAIPDAAVVFGVFGGLIPEKRIRQVLDAFETVLPYAPTARLVLAGAPAAHYDLHGDVNTRSFRDHVVITGALEDDDFTEQIAACDVAVTLRWPTAREISGPWLRALAAGRPTITMDLSHTADVPSLDPRRWAVAHASTSVNATVEPVTVAIDILDEEHSLRLAMRRLATDDDLRARLSVAAVEFWRQAHSPAVMLQDYRRVIARAISTPDPEPDLPRHLRGDGGGWMRELLEPFGLDASLWSRT